MTVNIRRQAVTTSPFSDVAIRCHDDGNGDHQGDVTMSSGTNNNSILLRLKMLRGETGEPGRFGTAIALVSGVR